MSYFKTTVGRGCWAVSTSARKKLRMVNLVLWLLQLGTGITFLLKKSRDPGYFPPNTDWQKYLLIFTLVQQSLIQLWNVWIILGKVEKKEKFCLTVQGTHQRKQNRSRRTIYGVAISDEIRVEYEKNPEGILVFFRKLPSGSSSSNTGPACAPFQLPLQGWFPFLQFLGLAALTTYVTLLAYYYHSHYYLFYSYQMTMLALLCFTLVVQVAIFLSSYSVAQDCGCMFPLLFIGYTRWFKHTSAYTELLQDQLQAKFGQQLKAEGEQLEQAIRQYTSRTMRPDGVEVRNVGPVTKKRYDDQVRLLHVLLAAEHDKSWKEATTETLETGGASFIVTREEMERLEEWAEEKKVNKVDLQMENGREELADNCHKRETVPAPVTE